MGWTDGGTAAAAAAISAATAAVVAIVAATANEDGQLLARSKSYVTTDLGAGAAAANPAAAALRAVGGNIVNARRRHGKKLQATRVAVVECLAMRGRHHAGRR